MNCLGDKLAKTSWRIDAELHSFLTDLRQFDEGRGWALTGMLSCAHWLSWRCGIALGAGREKMRVARALPALPLINEALRAGTITYSKVRALTRVATPENEAELVEIAKGMPAAHVEDACRRHVQKRPPGTEPERYLRVRETTRGMVRMSLQLRPEEMARLLAAIDASSDARVDGILAMAEAKIRGDQPEKPPVDVVVHIDAASLTGTQDDVGLSKQTCLRLLCDAGIATTLDDAEGRPPQAGERKRTFSPEFRRALVGRDGRCRFPGCTHRRFLEGHYIKHWVAGGETTMENVILLCLAHHKLVEESGFRILVTDGEARFFTPRGTEVMATSEEVSNEEVGSELGWEDEDVDFLREKLYGDAEVPASPTD